ncbi:MAG: MaoC family dehydratase [Gammaproteobacteria bacterium]|nr:MaoC family dehydratase [Gammaproteobacteria bacterium]
MTQSTSIPYDSLEVGQSATFSKQVTEYDIMMFASMSGDRNPVHLDADYAAGTMFKERIAHGMFSGALISAAVACELPGPGTIYLGQQMEFKLPVKLGDTLTVQLEILEKLPKFRVRIATRVVNQRDEIVVDGEALIIAPRKEVTVQLAELPKFVAQPV